jgi:hypothetical protein
MSHGYHSFTCHFLHLARKRPVVSNSMLEVIELECDDDPEEENNNHNEHDDDGEHDDDDEGVSLMSGLTNHSSLLFHQLRSSTWPPQLTAFASPYGKLLTSMKASATLRRRESLGRAACGISSVVVLLFLVVVAVAWTLHHHQHHHHPHNHPRGGGHSNKNNTTPAAVPPQQQLPPSQVLLLSSSSSVETNMNNMTNISPVVVLVDIVVQMSGELGNHLSKLASGVGIAIALRDTYGIPSNLRLRHQDSRTEKWRDAVSHLQSCFPFARDLNFSEAQAVSPTSILFSSSRYNGVNSDNETIIRTAIRNIAQDALMLSPSNNNNTNYNNESAAASAPPINISVYSNHLSVLDAYMDRYYDVYRDYFRMDDESCCSDGIIQRPEPDEIVFHLRLFTHEMPHKGLQMGYEELSPSDLVHQALSSSLMYEPTFDDSNTGNSNNQTKTKKIALVSRYPDQLDEYVDILQGAGWTVRVMVNQTTMQDFCFLRHTQYRLMGSVRSTFFWWAAVLSSSSSSVDNNDHVAASSTTSSSTSSSPPPVHNLQVLAYSMDSPAKRAWALSHNTSVWETYDFTNPAISAKFHFPLYKATTITTGGGGGGGSG